MNNGVVFRFLCFAAILKASSAIQCYSCIYGSTTTQGVLTDSCGPDFNPQGQGVSTVDCSGACTKAYAKSDVGEAIVRGCENNPTVTSDTCAEVSTSEGHGTACFCFGNLCNASNVVVSGGHVLLITVAIWAMYFV